MTATTGTTAGGARRFRPTLGATLATLAGLALTVGLGTWQVERLRWKTDLIERVAQRATGVPVPLPAHVGDPEGWEFRPVTLAGHFLNDKELLLIARPHQGAAGYEVMVPFQRADGGGVVLVNRGFVPMDRRDPASRLDGRVEGDTTVRGVVRLPREGGLFQPGNDGGNGGGRDGVWMRPDPAAMAAARSLDGVAPVLVEELPNPDRPNPDRSAPVPSGLVPRVDLPNNHLQYAITWYGLALTLLAIYVLSQRRPATGDAGGRAGRTDAAMDGSSP